MSFALNGALLAKVMQGEISRLLANEIEKAIRDAAEPVLKKAIAELTKGVTLTANTSFSAYHQRQDVEITILDRTK